MNENTREKRPMPTLPNAEEIEKITPIIKDEFVKHGIEIEKIGPHPTAGWSQRRGFQ